MPSRNSPPRRSPSSSSPGIGLPYGDSGGVVEQVDQPALDGLGHHVLPAAGLGVHQLPVEPDHVGEQPLGQPVLAHHPGGQAQALGGELEVAVALDGHQPVALHPGDRLRHRRARLVQPLGDPGTQRDDALLDQLVDGPEVHLRGVDQVAHRVIVTHRAKGWQSGAGRAEHRRSPMPDLSDVLVPARFCGPPSSGNGGWSAGAIAAPAGDGVPDDHALPWPAVTVSLLAPPPLDVPMSVSTGRRTAASSRRTTARPVLSAALQPRRRSPTSSRSRPDEARAAMASYAGLTSHPFPTCFSCGTGRADGDGLRIFPGRVGDATDEGRAARPRVAATWTPDPSVAEDFHAYADEHPRASAAGHLGRARLRRRLGRRPRGAADGAGPDDRPARLPAGDRRGARAWSGSAAAARAARPGPPSTLYDADGRVVGTAEHLWIAVDPAAFA